MAPVTPKKRNLSRRKVVFGFVQVREYEVVAGNHPWVTEGPSLSIGWRFIQKKKVSLQKYENERERTDCVLAPLSANTRRFILSFSFEISQKDIRRSEAVAERARLQRQTKKVLLKKSNAQRQIREKTGLLGMLATRRPLRGKTTKHVQRNCKKRAIGTVQSMSQRQKGQMSRLWVFAFQAGNGQECRT